MYPSTMDFSVLTVFRFSTKLKWISKRRRCKFSIWTEKSNISQFSVKFCQINCSFLQVILTLSVEIQPMPGVTQPFYMLTWQGNKLLSSGNRLLSQKNYNICHVLASLQNTFLSDLVPVHRNMVWNKKTRSNTWVFLLSGSPISGWDCIASHYERYSPCSELGSIRWIVCVTR